MKNKQIKQEDITLEASLLKAMSNRKAFKQFNKTLDKKKLIPITTKLLKDYETYYKQHKTDDIDWGLFYTEFSQNWHKDDLDSQDLTYYRETVFPLIQNSVVDDGVYIALLERESATKIASIIENGVDTDKIAQIIAELNKKKSVYTKENRGVAGLTDLDLSDLDNENGGIEWFLPSLQSSIGSLMPGQFVLVSADNNTGKGAFIISQVAHTIKKGSERPILYFDSEHTQKELNCRVLSNFYKDRVPNGFEDVWKKQDKIFAHFNESYGTNKFYSYQIGGPSDLQVIEQLIEEYDPCLIVIDMIDVLSNSQSIQDLTPLYDRIRYLSNQGRPILGTTQAGNTSYYDKEENQYKHRKWLTDKDTSGSKGAGKQGAAYCMIMIGKDDDMPNIRYITTTKKKRGKNCNITAEISEIHSSYKEIL